MKDPLFSKTPPKSLDRYSFTLTGMEDFTIENGAATLVEFTALSFEFSLSQCPEAPTKIFITGGGRHNPTLMKSLKDKGLDVRPVEKLGWDGDFLEAEAFGFLACRHLKELPLTYPDTTGVLAPCTGGVLHRPK